MGIQRNAYNFGDLSIDTENRKMSVAGGVSRVDVTGGAGISVLVVNQFKHLGPFKHDVKLPPKSAKWFAVCFLFCKYSDNFMMDP